MARVSISPAGVSASSALVTTTVDGPQRQQRLRGFDQFHQMSWLRPAQKFELEMIGSE